MNIVDRLRKLSTAVAERQWDEFTMSVPVREDRDADVVLSRAADELHQLRADKARLEAELAAIDSRLSGRPALAHITGRADKVEHACVMAGRESDRANKLEAELAMANDAALKGAVGRAMGTAYEECQKELDTLRGKVGDGNTILAGPRLIQMVPSDY